MCEKNQILREKKIRERYCVMETFKSAFKKGYYGNKKRLNGAAKIGRINDAKR